MLTHRGFSACIEANGTFLPEYLVSVDEKSSRVSCWIPGIEGQTFTVHWCDEGSKVTTCAFIILDGVIVPGRFLPGEGATSRGGMRVSKTTERPFIFKKVKETDGATQEDSKDAGLIILKIKRINCTTSRAPNPIQIVPSVGALGMRKKGDLCVGFGEEMEVEAQYGATWKVSSYESDKPGVKPRTYVSFAFRYRSPEFLEAQGIASMEQTQPWVAHTRRFTQRTVSLPIPIPNVTNPATTSTPPSSTTSTPLVDPLTKMSSLPSTTLPDLSQGEMGPLPTPASSISTDINSSPELLGHLPLLNSCSSTPPPSESAIDSTNPLSSLHEPIPIESELDKSLGRLGKGKAPVIWRPWIHPNSRQADPRRTVSWKMSRSTSDGSARSVRGVERNSPSDDSPSYSPQAYEGAFMVSLSHQNSPKNVQALSK